jgi:UDP-N-acetylmuramate dehydrogenase
MTIDELKELLKKFDSSITYSADLKKKNWFNIGGKAKVFFKADELTDLVEFLKVLDNREKIHIIGAGSNTLITDEVYDGVIIKLGKNFNRLSVLNSNIIISGTAVLDKKLSDFAAENSLSGFEFLSCIPGTVGGGIKMNAGCFGTEIKDILVSIQSVDKNGNVLTIPAKEINFEYRNNDLSETKIKTSGSTFKNPINLTSKKVWELIKESVPADVEFGDACISKKHSNFFVNKGNASFKDMKKLINFVEKSVFNKTGVKIEKEIKILEN